MMGLPGRERSWAMSLAVWIQYTSMTDRHGRTDRHRSTAMLRLYKHSVAQYKTNCIGRRPPQYAPASHVTLTYDLLTLKVVSESRVK